MTHDQMLELWMLTRYHLPLNDQATVSVDSTFGVDTLRLETAAMQAWYLQLLDNAPVNLLPVENCADGVGLLFGQGGTAVVTLPQRCRRLVSVQLSSWAVPATIVTPSHPLAQMQCSTYARGGVNSPVAILDGRTLTLFTPAGASDRLTRLDCVVDNSPEHYDLDPSLLSTIPPLIPS